jgi:hypothetical protein
MIIKITSKVSSTSIRGVTFISAALPPCELVVIAIGKHPPSADYAVLLSRRVHFLKT